LITGKKGLKNIFTGYRTIKAYEKLTIPKVATATAIGVVTGGVITGGLGILGATAGAGVAS